MEVGWGGGWDVEAWGCFSCSCYIAWDTVLYVLYTLHGVRITRYVPHIHAVTTVCMCSPFFFTLYRIGGVDVYMKQCRVQYGVLSSIYNDITGKYALHVLRILPRTVYPSAAL